MSNWWIDVETPAGVLVGSGPIITARGFSYTDRCNQAGVFSFSMPASDPKAAYCVSKNRVRCYTVINGAVTEIGAGIIDRASIREDANGVAQLDVAGDNMLRELAYRHVGALEISDGAGGPDTTGPADIIALAPTGWALDTTNGHNATVKSIFHLFAGETCLNAFVKLAELSGERFRLGTGKNLIWMQAGDVVASGIRLTHGGDPVAIQDNHTIGLITGIVKNTDSYETGIGRVYAIGNGNGTGALTLNGASVPAAYTAAGWSVANDSKGYYLQHSDTWTAYGMDAQWEFKDINDVQTLLEQTYERMNKQRAPKVTYDIQVTKLDAILYPGNTIQVVYRKVTGGYVEFDVNSSTLIIQETTTQVDSAGVRTVALRVGETDTPPLTDAGATIAGFKEPNNFITHPQPGSSTTLSHNHASATDGGILTNDQHDGASDYVEIAAPSAPSSNHAVLFARDVGGVTELCVRLSSGDILPIATQGITVPTYAASNVTTDRTYDADTVLVAELADIVGTLIADLRLRGIVK